MEIPKAINASVKAVTNGYEVELCVRCNDGAAPWSRYTAVFRTPNEVAAYLRDNLEMPDENLRVYVEGFHAKYKEYTENKVKK